MAEHYTRHVRRQLHKRVPTNDGRGVTSVPDGAEIGTVHLTIDVDRIMETLGRDALTNKSGKARGLGGLIVAKVLTRKREG